MRWLALLLGNLLVLVVVVTAILMIPEHEDVGGRAHERYETLQSGGSGVERHENVFWLGALFGASSLVFFGALMAFGARRGASTRGLALPLFLVLGLSLGIWLAILSSYQADWSLPEAGFFLTLPVPAAIVLYGLFPITILFNLLYVIGFRRWILTDEDYEAYERLLARRRGRSS